MYLKPVEITSFCGKTHCIAEVHITENTFWTTKIYFADQGIIQHRKEMCFFVLCISSIELF
jgi:hypothetical protein